MIDDRYALTINLDEGVDLNVLYEGYDTLRGEYVWVKFIEPTKYMSNTFLSDFIDECTVINNIGCSSILNVVGVGNIVLNDINLIYIVSEYSEGLLLEDMIRGKLIHLEGIVAIATQIVKCLDRLHSNGLYHGSLHPSNIIVDKNYNIKLLEVGITKANSGINIRDNISKYYMSPYQINLDYTDFESDFYILGVVLFKSIFNKMPYTVSDDAMQMLKSIDKGVEWHTLTPFYMQNNGKLLSIVRRLLDRKDKYVSMTDVLIDLSEVLYDNANIEG